jgi:hypothetical protein
MDAFINQLIGFIVGILSSWAFWYLLIIAKPKVKVSQHIVFNKRTGNLLVKIANEGRRQATDIQASLALIERKPSGRFQTLYVAQLKRDNLPALAPKRESHRPWGIPTAFVFVTHEGQAILEKFRSSSEGEKRIVFTMSAIDGLSGTKVVSQVAYRLNDLKYGQFGLWLDLIEDNAQLPRDQAIQDQCDGDEQVSIT